MENKETFGQRIARLRKNKGYTQEEIAEKECVSAQAVSKWENDITSPDINTLIDLSYLYGVTLDELLGKQETTEKTGFVEENKRKNISDMLLKIRVVDGKDKVSVNLPVALIKVFLQHGEKVPLSVGKKDVDIDFNMVIEMIEKGVVGELVTMEDEDGAKITIFVE